MSEGEKKQFAYIETVYFGFNCFSFSHYTSSDGIISDELEKNGVSFSLIKVIDKLNDLIATKRPIISPRTSKLHKVISNCLVIILVFFTRLMLLRVVWLFVVCTFFIYFLIIFGHLG